MRNPRCTALLALFILVFIGSACGQKETGPAKPEGSSPASPSQTRAVDLDQRPAGVRVVARRVRLDKPFEAVTRGERIRSSDVVEFEVSAREPIPARALDPVLLVGDRAVTSYRYTDPKTLVFTEPDPSKLPRRAAVQFRWGGEGPVYGLDYIFVLETIQTIRR